MQQSVCLPRADQNWSACSAKHALKSGDAPKIIVTTPITLKDMAATANLVDVVLPRHYELQPNNGEGAIQHTFLSHDPGTNLTHPTHWVLPPLHKIHAARFVSIHLISFWPDGDNLARFVSDPGQTRTIGSTRQDRRRLMTEMVYGLMPARAREPMLPRWWRTIDKWSMTAILGLFGIGLLLGLAASVPLASRNGLPPFYYVQREAFFGAVALGVMFGFSMMTPAMIRRLGVLGFMIAFVMLILLPFLGTDFGKGAVRWYSLGFISLQPSEFLKPGFIIVTAWLMAAAAEVNGPPGKTLSFCLTVLIVGFLAMQPDFGQAMLVLFGWGVIYFIAGAPMLLIAVLLGVVGVVGTFAYSHSEHFARRIEVSWPQISTRAARSAMPPMLFRRADFLASASAMARSNGPCRMLIPISSLPSPPKNMA